MNFLAHAYLSFGYPDILAGNLICDFVRGKQVFNYPEAIQKGIALHRAIDTFTDAHPITTEAKKVFKPVVRLYAGAFTDVVYDHFLATDANEFTDETLAAFAQKTYNQLTNFQHLFPSKQAHFFLQMQQQNWLYNYRFMWAIKNSFRSIEYRALYLDNTFQPAFEIFEKNYDFLKDCYGHFFIHLKEYARELLHCMLDTDNTD